MPTCVRMCARVCGRSVSLPVALISANTVKLKNTNCIIPQKINVMTSLLPTQPSSESNLWEKLGEFQQVPVWGLCLLTVSVFPFHSWEQGGYWSIYKNTLASQWRIGSAAQCGSCVSSYHTGGGKLKMMKTGKSTNMWLFDAEDKIFVFP